MTNYSTLYAAERQLDDFVKDIARNYALTIRSPFEPLEMTASEQQLLCWMRQNVESIRCELTEQRKRLRLSSANSLDNPPAL